MKILGVVSWSDHVLPVWREAAKHTGHFNHDIWSRLPEGVCWFECILEVADVKNLYVIGAKDWQQEFGSYRMLDVSGACKNNPASSYHQARIAGIRQSIEDGWEPTPIIMVAEHGEGPFVVLDGNHRSAAFDLSGKLVGQKCLVGFHHLLHKEFVWYWRVFENSTLQTPNTHP